MPKALIVSSQDIVFFSELLTLAFYLRAIKSTDGVKKIMFQPSLSATTFRSRRERSSYRPLITITGKQRIGLGSTVSNLTRLRITAAGRNRRHFSNCCLFSGLQSLTSLLSSSFSLILFSVRVFLPSRGVENATWKNATPSLSYV